jgi:hypothetical protein
MKLPLLAALAAALSLTGCAVYTPLQPTLPSIRNAGEVEFRGSIQPASLRPEASVTYSPAKHALVSVAGSWRPQLKWGDTSLFRTKALEVGGGGYLPVGPHWTLSGLGGFGWGATDRSVSDGSIILSYHSNYYSRYNTRFGQVGMMFSYNRFKLGLGYRLTQLRFDELRTDELALPLETQLRHAPFFTACWELGKGEVRRWQLEVSGSLALARSYKGSSDSSDDTQAYLINMNRGAAANLGFGVVYRLHKQPRGQ